MYAHGLAKLPRLLQRHCIPCSLHKCRAYHRLVRTTRVVTLAKSNQKNEGVYFDYEPVDPDAADELEMQDDQEADFGWAQRSRAKKEAMQQKYKAIERNMAGGRKGRTQKGDKRGPRTPGASNGASGERRPAAGAGPRSSQSAGPRPAPRSSGPAVTPTAQPRPVAPDDERLVRPRNPADRQGVRQGGAGPAQAEPAQSGAVAGPGPKAEAAAPTQATPSASAPPAASAQPVERDGGPEAAIVGSSAPAGGSSTAAAAGAGAEGAQASTPAAPAPTGAAAAAGAAGSASVTPVAEAGNNRRQRLLKRMKGGAGGSAGAAPDPEQGRPAAAGPAAAGGDAGFTADATAAAAAGAAAPSARHPEVAAGSSGTDGAALAAAAAAATAAAGMAPSALDADLRRQLSSLAAQLPAEASLPEDARPARALLESILNPAGEDLREATAGDVADMLQRDLRESAEFRQWLRRAAGQQQQQSGGGGGGEELSEAEAADLAAALANLDVDDLEDWGSDPELAEALGDGEGGDGDGDEAVDAAMREVAELRELMAAMDAGDEPGQGRRGGAGRAGEDGADMTDEQVLAMLRKSDPELYELLKDVPEFEKLGLDEELDLDLDSASEQLTEEDMAELAAEAAGGGGGRGGGGGDEEELEELLRDMRNMGLMRDGAADDDQPVSDDDDDDLLDDDGDDGEGGLGLGDLLEAIDEDEELDPAARTRAQFALQSMFNQPADELAAKGSRGGAGAESGEGKGKGADAKPPVPRGTTGLARGAVSPDDEDGGAAPPPLLPRPKPKGR